MTRQVAERRFLGRWNRIGASHDWGVVAELAQLYCGSQRQVDAFVKWMETVTEDMIDQPLWRAVFEPILRSLLEHRVLTGRQLRSAFNDGIASALDRPAPQMTPWPRRP